MPGTEQGNRETGNRETVAGLERKQIRTAKRSQLKAYFCTFIENGSL